MKLQRYLGISQNAAWHLAHCISRSWADSDVEPFAGPVEADETYIGGRAEDMHSLVGRQLIAGRGAIDKTAVVGVKDRSTGRVAAKVVGTDGPTLRGFVTDRTAACAEVFTDEASAYVGLPNRATACHSVGEHVNGIVHINGAESSWAGLKRGYDGTHHHMSAKHLDREIVFTPPVPESVLPAVVQAARS